MLSIIRNIIQAPEPPSTVSVWNHSLPFELGRNGELGGETAFELGR